jgi:hypothetical protein
LSVPWLAADVRAVYAFYQHLWDGDHDLQWAGMAKLAGAPVYGGLEDLQVLSQLPRDQLVGLAEAGSPLAGFLVQCGTGEARWYEAQFLQMQKNIYQDLGWQHDAYEHGGIDAIRSLAVQGAIWGLGTSGLEEWHQQVRQGRRQGV